MIWTLMKVNMIMLVRDKVSIGLVFILPIIFFSIFAQVFGTGDKDGPTVQIAYVDQDQTDASRRLAQVLGEQSRNLRIMDRPGVGSPLYTPEQIRKVVADGDVPVGLVIPKGFQDELLEPTGKAAPLQLVSDPAQPIALQVAQGVIRKVLFQDMSEVMMLRGIAQLKSATGGLTGRQEKLEELVQKAAQNQIMGKTEDPEQKNATGNEPKLDSFMIPITTTQVDRKTSEGSNRKLVNYYAAAIGVMFLLFSCVGAAGSLLDEALASAAQIADADPKAVFALKALMNDGVKKTLGDALVLEGERGNAFAKTVDYSQMSARLASLRQRAAKQ